MQYSKYLLALMFVIQLSFITSVKAFQSSKSPTNIDKYNRLKGIIGERMADFIASCSEVMEHGGTLEHFFLFEQTPYDSFKKLKAAGLTNERKSLFFCFVLPIIVFINDWHQQNRQILLDFEKLLISGHPLNTEQQEWVEELFGDYTHPSDPKNLTVDEQIQLLKRRIDIIPVSLAMAQAALESGWGMSRFARQGNALFGEVAAKSEPGIVALNNSHHRVKIFGAVFKSVFSYMRDLNFHPAYKEFRLMRQQSRFKGIRVRGTEAIYLLDRYAEDPKYHIKIIATIRANNLSRFDSVSMTDFGVKIPRQKELKQVSLR